MSVDFQVCFPQESIKINAIQLVAGSSPAVVDVLGQDFSSVDEVLVNEVPAPSYFVVSRNRMFVTLPEIVPPASIQSVAVTSSKLTLTDKSLIKFRVNRVPSKVTGILRLVQLFLKILFTTPGTDIFNKRLGAAALKNLGRTFGKTQSGGIISDFVVAVDNTTRQIITLQGRQPQLSAEEKLLAAKVTAANFTIQQSALVVSVELTSQAGRAALANVVV